MSARTRTSVDSVRLPAGVCSTVAQSPPLQTCEHFPQSWVQLEQVSPRLQAPSLQAQTPALQAPVQEFPQLPQLLPLDIRFVSQPSPELPLQFPQPLSQLTTLQ